MKDEFFPLILQLQVVLEDTNKNYYSIFGEIVFRMNTVKHLITTKLIIR